VGLMGETFFSLLILFYVAYAIWYDETPEGE
jgi:hypothetical protein